MSRNPELIGVCVGVVPGTRIQMLDDSDENRFIVRNLEMDGGVESNNRYYSYKEPGTKDSALVATLDEFVKRIRAEREGLKVFVPIEEYALLLNANGDAPEINEGEYHVYEGREETIAMSVAEAENKAIEHGMYDMEELRSQPEYTASIAALIAGAPEDEHIGIALLIR